jgi:hypothetical protein
VGFKAVLDAVLKRKFPNPLRESNPRTPIVQPSSIPTEQKEEEEEEEEGIKSLKLRLVGAYIGIFLKWILKSRE